MEKQISKENLEWNEMKYRRGQKEKRKEENIIFIRVSWSFWVTWIFWIQMEGCYNIFIIYFPKQCKRLRDSLEIPQLSFGRHFYGRLTFRNGLYQKFIQRFLNYNQPYPHIRTTFIFYVFCFIPHRIWQQGFLVVTYRCKY